MAVNKLKTGVTIQVDTMGKLNIAKTYTKDGNPYAFVLQNVSGRLFFAVLMDTVEQSLLMAEATPKMIDCLEKKAMDLRRPFIAPIHDIVYHVWGEYPFYQVNTLRTEEVTELMLPGLGEFLI